MRQRFFAVVELCALGIGALALSSIGLVPASAASYTYNYTSVDPLNTSGSFTVTGSPGAYSLTSFAGKVAGVSYNASTVGLDTGSPGYVYIGGLLSTVGDYQVGTNDFTQSGAFKPGVSYFSDFLQYSTVGAQSAATIAVTFSQPGVPVYTYSYTSGDPTKTSGTFTIVGEPNAYKLSQFAGKVGGVSYDTSQVGLFTGTGGRQYLGGRASGDPLEINPANFEQHGTFLPGVGYMADVFNFATPGSNNILSQNVEISLPSAIALSYSYTFTSSDPKKTSGSFTITGKPNAYTLSQFVGTIGGVTYDTSTVGLARGSDGSFYLAGLANGLELFTINTNDFEQQSAFIPGNGAFSATFAYARTGSQNLHEADVTFSPFTPASSVPEPISWVMMIVGFGFVGLALRCRSKAVLPTP